MKKKILALCLVVVLAVTAVTGATLAYFTDTDSQKNVMTTGKVDIKQHEEQRYFNENGEVWTMGDFEQNKPLMPMVDNREDGDPETVDDAIAGEKVFNKMNNVVDKFVSVTNVAEPNAINQDAYVRTILAFETARHYAEGSSTDFTDMHKTYIGVNGTFEYLDRYVTIDGVEYILAVHVYKEALAPGEKSDASLRQIFLAPTANNEVMDIFGSEYTILALSQATQTAGFTTAAEALDTAFGALSGENAVDDATLIKWLSAVK